MGYILFVDSWLGDESTRAMKMIGVAQREMGEISKGKPRLEYIVARVQHDLHEGVGVNTGRAIPLGFGKSDFGITLTDTTGKPLVLEDLSQDRLKKLITAVSETRKKKYGRNNTKKYGNLRTFFRTTKLN